MQAENNALSSNNTVNIRLIKKDTSVDKPKLKTRWPQNSKQDGLKDRPEIVSKGRSGF